MAVYVTFLASWTGCIKVEIIWVIPAQNPEYRVCWLNILDVSSGLRLNTGGNIIARAAAIFQKAFWTSSYLSAALDKYISGSSER